MNLGGTFVGALFALTISVSNVTAQQQVITVCGASAGFGYYLEPKHDGWTKDGISMGTLTVMRHESQRRHRRRITTRHMYLQRHTQ
jgi:hypothetical protein